MSAQLFYLPFAAAAKPTNIGAPGAKAYFYAPSSTTLRAVYATSALTTQLSNPVIADGAGRFPAIYLDNALTYKLAITDKLGANIITPIDPYIPGTAPDASSLSPYADAAAASAANAALSASTALAAVAGIDPSDLVVITPDMFGAVGDGATDDSGAIQDAIDAAVAVGGGTIIFAAKKYLSSTALTWSGAPVLLQGSGSSDQTGVGTILKFPAGLSGAVNPKNGAAGLGQGSGLADMTIEGTGLIAVSDADAINGVGAGILFQCNSWRANNVVVRGFEGHGVLVRSGLTVADPTINANGGTGYRLHTISNLKAGYAVEGVDSNVCVVTNLVSYDNVDGIYDNSRVGNNTYDTPLFADCSGWAVRFGANSAGHNHVRNAYAEIDITNLVKFETGSDGHNRVEFAVGTGTVTDNSTSQTNTVELQGVKSFERFGSAGVETVRVSPSEVTLTNSASLILKDTANNSTWLLFNGGGNAVFTCATPGYGYYIFTAGAQRASVLDDGLHVVGVGAFSDALTSSGAAAGIGYATGAGGTVTQATNKSTGVTLNKVSGAITMNNAALAAGAKVSFVVTNSVVAATDVIVPSVKSGGTASAYRAAVTAVAAGSFTVTVENITAGSLSEAPIINFAVVKAVAA